MRWEPGFNAAEPRSCGSFVGSDIVLYGHAIDPRTHALGACGNADRVTETLAHEIGHALGLLDRYESECYGSIMSQLVWMGGNAILPRSVRAFECDAADLAFDTPAERRRLSRRPVLLASAPLAETGESAAARSLLTLTEAAPPRNPKSARAAPGSHGTESDGFRP